jgi:signal transduction histidine kinase
MKAIPKRISAWRSAPVAIFVAAIMIVLVGVAVIIQSDNAYRDARRDFAISQAQILAASAAAAVDFNDPVAAQEAVNPLRVITTLRSAAVYGRDGQLIAGYDRSGEAVPALEQGIAPASSDLMRVSAPVEMAGQRIGTAYIQLDRQPVWRRVSRYGTLAVLVAAASLIILGLGFAQRALRSANRELANRAEALAQANEMLGEQMEERAKAEDQLRQSQKMQALGQLTGGIAHDFNNLLTVIQGSADMLCKKELPEAKRVRFAKAIVQASENAAALTSQLLAFARRQPLKPERLDLDRILAELQDLIDRTMGERVQVSMKLDGPGCSVEADKAQLQSAILNIASNARDAMIDGGRLRISTREVNEPGGRMIAIDFTDTGHGMDAETLDRVFEPFFTTKKERGGTGLGLAVAYGVVRQHRGLLHCYSEPGVGTVFKIYLPVYARVASDISSKIVGAAPRGYEKILLGEDDPAVRGATVRILESAGYNVVAVENGAEACQAATRGNFDLVLLDVIMPEMSCRDALRGLRAELPNARYILSSGYTAEVNVGDLLQDGTILLEKPYDPGQLLRLVRQVLDEAH